MCLITNVFRQEEEAKQEEAAAAAAGEHLRHRIAYNRRLRATQSPNYYPSFGVWDDSRWLLL